MIRMIIFFPFFTYIFSVFICQLVMPKKKMGQKINRLDNWTRALSLPYRPLIPDDTRRRRLMSIRI